jgi:hypothetical protein
MTIPALNGCYEDKLVSTYWTLRILPHKQNKYHQCYYYYCKILKDS